MIAAAGCKQNGKPQIDEGYLAELGGQDLSKGPPMPSPQQLWERCKETLAPLTYEIVNDEIVTSNTDPSLSLRRIEIRFISQEIEGVKMGHEAVIIMPSGPEMNRSLDQGKVVIVTGRYGDDTITGNYGEPIAARTVSNSLGAEAYRASAVEWNK